MTVWLWAFGTPPDDNTYTLHHPKQTDTERCSYEADLLFHSDRSEGHNHVITPASEEEEPRSLVFWYSRETGESVCVRVFDNEEKINRRNRVKLWMCTKAWLNQVCVCMQVTVCRQRSTPVWAGALWRCLSYHSEERVWTGMRLKENVRRPLRLSEGKHTAFSLQQNTLKDWLATPWF